MDYMTISEAATKWNLSNRRIQTLCSQGRIPGAERAGYCWLLPKDAEKPVDARIKSGKYIGYSEKYKKPGKNIPLAIISVTLSIGLLMRLPEVKIASCW